MATGKPTATKKTATKKAATKAPAAAKKAATKKAEAPASPLDDLRDLVRALLAEDERVDAVAAIAGEAWLVVRWTDGATAGVDLVALDAATRDLDEAAREARVGEHLRALRG